MSISSTAALTFRDFSTDGVPSSGANDPVKADIRALFSVVDGAMTSVINGMVVGGAVIYATQSALFADLLHVAGVLGVVYNDGAAANNGVYVKSGGSGSGSWSITNLALPSTFAASLSALTTSLNSEIASRQSGRVEIVACSYPPINDFSNTIGGGIAAYLPRAFYYQRGGVISNVAAAGPSEATELAHYVKVALSNLGGPSFVWYDISGNSFHSAPFSSGAIAAPSTNLDNIVPFGVIYGDGVSSNIRWVSTDDSARQSIYPLRPFVIEAQTLLVPAFYYRDPFSGYVLVQPADGSAFWELAISQSGNLSTHYFDSAALRRGDPTFIKTATGGGSPLEPSSTMIKLAHSIDGVVSTDYPLIGDVPGGLVANQCLYTFYADQLPTPYYGTTTIVNVTNAALTALSLLRGWTDTTNHRPFVNLYFAKARRNQRVFFRMWAQTDTPDSFGTPDVYLFTATNAVSAVLVLNLEKKLSSTAAIFSATFLLPTDDTITNFNIGVDNLTTQNVIICGIQYHCGDAPAWWIPRFDMGTVADNVTDAEHAHVPSIDLLYGPDMFLISGRKLPLFPPNILQIRAEPTSYVAAMWALKADLPYVASGREQISIDPALVPTGTGGANGQIQIRSADKSFGEKRYIAPIRVHVAPASTTGTIKVHMIGDSLTNRWAVPFLAAKLANMGFTATMIGSINNNGGQGEGREGKAWADYTYELTSNLAPVTVGGEAAYLALSDANKANFNPYLKTPTAGDIASRSAYIYNSYIFDMAFYLSRFSYSNPDFVIIHLGQNDWRINPASAPSWISHGLTVLYNQIRAALPSAHIAITSAAWPRGRFSDSYYTVQKAQGMILPLLAFRRANAGDTKLWVLPCWAHQSPDIGWTDTASVDSTDGSTGAERVTMTDAIHYDDVNRQLFAEVSAAWIGAVKANT